MANVFFGRTDRLTDILTDSSTAKCHLTGGIKINFLCEGVFAQLRGSAYKPNVDGWRTKTNPKTSPAPEQSAIFQLVQEINKTNALTKFHDDKAKNENCPTPTGGHAKNVTSRIIAPPPPTPGSHVIQLTRTIFELNSCIKETNVLTKFHENQAKNESSRVFTCFHKCPTHWRPCFFTDLDHFRTRPRYDNKTNVLTNFYDDWAKIVTSSVFTRKTAPPFCGHVFQRTRTTFELNQH
ncbi:hypothetical protein DPMN_011567 [Dreissena polymorpha]|uniref:Uncharacterized protein n=1 Tax=Dreissena polymorpha TaxID=45954 RepID=A0A9D4S1Z1_DREPO|nr:hypothetical protein DPMN_011567 [Dreissena polymorpha]